MNDLAVALGLVLVLEGLIWAFAPDAGRKMLAMAAATDDTTLRRSGLIAIGLGCLIVWLVRG